MNGPEQQAVAQEIREAERALLERILRLARVTIPDRAEEFLDTLAAWLAERT